MFFAYSFKKKMKSAGVPPVTNHHINYAAYVSPDTATGKGKRRITFPTFLMASAACLMLAHVVARPSLDEVQQAAFDIAAPAIAMAQGPMDAVRSKISAVSDLLVLHDENAALRAENEKLKEWYQAALMLESENKALRGLLNVGTAPAEKFITTRVIADGSSTYAKSIVIEGGRGTGIIKGQGVMSRDGLLGRVIEAGTRTARVLLLQDVNSRIPVLVEGSNERAILAGTNDTKPVLDHLANDHKITNGQRVITSGLGGLFPFGIPIGETVVKADGSVEVALYADPERNQHVQVVDYGIKPLLNDPTYSASASVETDADSFEPN
ncbi:MAG: rod shape-determining protein MreC [Alphaproteobacteria bacterium]|nr:rod shape-determining protein MreC [Alphaproteobacteria bacterium]